MLLFRDADKGTPQRRHEADALDTLKWNTASRNNEIRDRFRLLLYGAREVDVRYGLTGREEVAVP